MVEVICEKSGLMFEARTKRTKNHPQIMALINGAYENGWYSQALETIKRGRERGFTTIEQFVDALRKTEASAIGARSADIEERIRREQDAKEARRQRHVTNDLLRDCGYRWQKYENDEEDIDLYGQPEYEWQLKTPDGRFVTVKEAMQELAYQNMKFAKEWLAERGIAEEMPAIEIQREAERRSDEQAKAEMKAEHMEIYQEIKAELLRNGIDDAKAEHEAIRLALPHPAHEDQAAIKNLASGISLVLNSDLRYGVMVGREWCGIDEVRNMPELAKHQRLLNEYAQKNEVRR